MLSAMTVKSTKWNMARSSTSNNIGSDFNMVTTSTCSRQNSLQARYVLL